MGRGDQARDALAVTRPPKGAQEEGEVKCSSRATEMSPRIWRWYHGRYANSWKARELGHPGSLKGGADTARIE